MNLLGRQRIITIDKIREEFPELEISDLKRAKNSVVIVRVRCSHKPFLPFSDDEALHPPCNKVRWVYLPALRRSKKLGFVPGKCKGCSKQKWYTNEHGYLITIIDGRAYRANRVALEKKIQRRLRADEDAHHINGDKLNNHPDNLAPRLKTNHGPGITEDDAAIWLNSGTKYSAKKREL